ncbi:hypothetical protein FOZ63_024596, partial [Perkinsus olseni]
CIRKSSRFFIDASIKLTPQTGTTADSVSQIQDRQSRPRRESLSEWASKFAAVYVIGGPGVQGQADKVVRSDESRSVSLRSGKGQLWFVAYKNKADGAEAMKDIESEQFR